MKAIKEAIESVRSEGPAGRALGGTMAGAMAVALVLMVVGVIQGPPSAPWRVPLPEMLPSGMRADIRCLALNIYWEARSEPIEGRVAIAAVTLNRLADPAFPDDVCEVVYHGGERRHRCQFSWWCDGKSDTPREEAAWQAAWALAAHAMLNGVDDPTDGALWYHADYVEPDWAAEKTVVTRIGRHIYYRDD